MNGAHLSEVHKVLEAGVEVGLLLQRADVLEVGVVDVRVHPEQALEDGADDVLEGRREGLPIVLREDAGVVHLHTPLCTLGSCLSSRVMTSEAGRKGSCEPCRIIAMRCLHTDLPKALQFRAPANVAVWGIDDGCLQVQSD